MSPFQKCIHSILKKKTVLLYKLDTTPWQILVFISVGEFQMSRGTILLPWFGRYWLSEVFTKLSHVGVNLWWDEFADVCTWRVVLVKRTMQGQGFIYLIKDTIWLKRHTGPGPYSLFVLTIISELAFLSPNVHMPVLSWWDVPSPIYPISVILHGGNEGDCLHAPWLLP